jgi:hypothetical protein
MFKFGKKKASMVPTIAKKLPGSARGHGGILDGQMSARNNRDSIPLVDPEKYEAGLRSSRHDLNNSMSFDLTDQDEYMNDSYFNVKHNMDKDQP